MAYRPNLLQRCSVFIGKHQFGFGIAVVLLLVMGLARYLLRPSSDTAFAISARSDVLMVEPLCADQMLWDLPPGHVIPASAPPESPVCEGDAQPVSVELRGGARAWLAGRAGGTLDVRLAPGPLAAACRLPQGRNVISVLVNGEELPGDAQGYIYRSGECAGGSTPSSNGVLTISGRMQIGAAIPEGAGWGASSVAVGLLREGEIRARHAAAFTGERLTLLNESIDPGSIVDTVPCLGEGQSETAATLSKDCLASAVSTPGFIQLRGDSVLDIQAYPSGEVGITPHRGVERRVRLTKWDIWKYSSVVQFLAVVLALLAVLLKLPEHADKLKALIRRRSEQGQHK